MSTDAVLFVLAPHIDAAADHVISLEREDFTDLRAAFERYGHEVSRPFQIPGGAWTTTKRGGARVRLDGPEGGFIHADQDGRPLLALRAAVLQGCVLNERLCTFVATTWPDQTVVLFLF